MAKRELSSTLKNLKFMQRASPKVEKPKEEEVKLKPDDGFSSLASVSRKCIVITEGNPYQGEAKGRMSFQNFNPSVDRMYQGAAATPSQSTSGNENQNMAASERENGDPSEDMIAGSPKNGPAADLKRKQPDVDGVDSLGYKSLGNPSGDGNGQASSRGNGKGSHKQQKRDKRLDWNVLRPPKLQARRSGNH
ncbi:unnamed protein product [Spirodela intermedia]|uniref:Uncharacterized protein n=1 Tax=Spirodela intermedia TaxID=51605 RepID=A0A7I8IHF5_SPIIN|nr:unnamed protein product [Spirodela intermedia]CAA6656806.1 unnamed protein product [Spirodela intermedia]